MSSIVISSNTVIKLHDGGGNIFMGEVLLLSLINYVTIAKLQTLEEK